MKKNNRKRFLKGSTLIEVLVAVVIIVIAITALVKIIIIGGRAGRSAHHSSEALIIAQRWIEKSKASGFNDNLFFSTVWIKENDEDEYDGRPKYLSWTYWVKREEKFVVLEQVTTPDSEIKDEPYKVRPFRDSNPADGFDDDSGQLKDLKQIIVTVGWAENKLVENANDLDTENVSWRNDVFWREVQLKTLMSKQSPSETSCCDDPGVGIPIIIDKSSGNKIAPYIEACTPLNIQVSVEDLCPNPKLHVVLYYIGANESDTQSITMEYMGSLGYYEALIPEEYVKNYDGACEADEPDGNPDFKFRVVATDSYIGTDCPVGTTRTSSSLWVSVDIKDTSVPIISNYSNSSIIAGGSGAGCHGNVTADIFDGCNGVNGINVGNLKVEIAPMDENGLYNEGDLFEIPLTDQNDNRFTWFIDEIYIKDYSNPDTDPAAIMDKLPDIYYRITAYDTCDQYTVVWSSMTVTPNDTKAPEFPLLDEKVDSMSSCMPWGSNIVFEFTANDECKVASAGLYIRNRGLANTKTISFSYSSPGLPASAPDIYVELTPADIDSPDDLIVQFWAEDDSNQRSVSKKEYTFYFEDAIAWDIDNISSAATYGESHDTVALIIKNMRSEPTYLSSLKLVDPTRIEIYNAAMANTYTVIPYIDKVVIESLTDTTSGVLWDWKTSDPTPGSRERAPVTIDFYNADIAARKLEPFERAVIRIHFLDALNDNPIPANPIGMNSLHFEMYLIGDANFEYECKSLFDFVTSGNSCPYADAGSDQISCMTVGHYMKVGSTFTFWGLSSFDPDGDPITFTWDFGDGHTSPDPWTYHIFDSIGLHIVTLEVSDGFCSSYDSIYVNVFENKPPVARMQYSPNPTGVGIPVNFNAGSSYDPNCEHWGFPGLTYLWDFGDSDTGTNTWESHTYLNTGTYTVTLTVWDSDIAADSISTDIEVLDASVCFLTNVGGWPSTFNGFVGTQIDFWGWVGDGISPYLYNWDFGDGDTASTEDAFHTYNSTGTYEVRFSVVDSSGCIGSSSFYITIYDEDQMVCDYAFVCAGNREYVELNDIFVDTGFVNLESEITGGLSFPGYWVNWNIADGNPNWDWQPNVSNVKFLAYGDKDVWLQAWDNSSGSCSTTKQAHVSAIEPIAAKSFTDSTTMTITFNVLGAPINISNVYIEGYDMPGGMKIKKVYLNGTLIYLGNAATMLNIATAQLLSLGENTLNIVGSDDYNATSYFRVQVTSANACGGTAAFEAP